jgi:hypothetical protein
METNQNSENIQEGTSSGTVVLNTHAKVLEVGVFLASTLREIQIHYPFRGEDGNGLSNALSKGVANERQKVALLLHSGGMELQELYYMLKPESEDNNLQECLNTLDAYFTPKVNVAFERHMFRQMQQKENETMDQFVCRLRQKSISCEFTNIDEAIRDQIIEKCRDPKLHRKFLEKTGTVTLLVLQDTARVHETVNTQMQSMDRSDTNQVHGIFQGNEKGKGKYGAKSDDRASDGKHKVAKKCYPSNMIDPRMY